MVALTCYAQAWGRLIEGEAKLKETGLVIKSPAGFPCISPYLSIVRGTSEELRKWASELGLTPSSRTKIKTPSTVPGNDPMVRLLADTRAAR